MCDECPPLADNISAPLSAYADAPLTIDAVAKSLGLPQEVADLAKDFLNNGVECHRCRVLVQGDDLNGLFSFVADTPMMDCASPPTILCQECGYRTAAFMGVQAAREVVEKRYGG